MLGFVFFAACAPLSPSPTPTGEIEATVFQGEELTPISKQRNNGIKGVQVIDRAAYRLTIDGMVRTPLSLTYSDLQKYPQADKLVRLTCVEGWDFLAKWSGPSLVSILDQAGVDSRGTIAIFYTADDDAGYTSLELPYLRDNNIIIGMKLNDITLTADRGFPFQVVAEGKWGYKWAKWVNRIEIADRDFLGFWEQNGYTNDGNLAGPGFGK